MQEKEEKTIQILSRLTEESENGTPILVEGKKDISALRALGVYGPILSVKTGGRSFLDVVFQLEEQKISKVILLLDFDRRGKQGTNRLKRNLEGVGIRVDLDSWLALLGSVGKDVQCVEGLPTYLDSLKSKTSIISQ